MSDSNSDSKAPSVIITCAFMMGLATVGLALRLYSRIGISRNVGADDALLLVAWMLQIACGGFIIGETHFGLGKHFDTISKPDAENFLKMVFGSILTYNVSLTFTKVSILLQYQRFLYTKAMKNICRGVLIFIVIYGVVTFVTTLTICLPVGSFWNVYKPPHCLDREALWMAHASLNIITDLCVILLPIPVILKLSLPLKQKYGLVAIFAIGMIVCLISILRLNSVQRAAKSSDLTWSNTPAAIWSQCEISIAIVCASLPGMKPLIRAWTGHAGDTTVDSDGTVGTAMRGLGNKDMRERGLSVGGLDAISDGELGFEEHDPPSRNHSKSSSERPFGPGRSTLDIDEKATFTKTSTGLIVPVHTP